ncbi:hypothetical protein BWD121_013880 [Bartonella sp. WD12.1]|nr:hypothetical protein BWD121_013880 [Bartonella sp. WD12.1]
MKTQVKALGMDNAGGNSRVKLTLYLILSSACFYLASSID